MSALYVNLTSRPAATTTILMLDILCAGVKGATESSHHTIPGRKNVRKSLRFDLQTCKHLDAGHVTCRRKRFKSSHGHSECSSNQVAEGPCRSHVTSMLHFCMPMNNCNAPCFIYCPECWQNGENLPQGSLSPVLAVRGCSICHTTNAR